MIEDFPASQTMHSVFYFIRKKQDNSMRISLTEKKITRNKKKRQPALGLALPCGERRPMWPFPQQQHKGTFFILKTCLLPIVWILLSMSSERRKLPTYSFPSQKRMKLVIKRRGKLGWGHVLCTFMFMYYFYIVSVLFLYCFYTDYRLMLCCYCSVVVPFCIVSVMFLPLCS